MLRIALIYIAVASCNAELYQLKTAVLPTTTADNRIVGGSATTIEQYPFVVQVRSNRQFCGGSLVTTRHVLSAAHCFVARNGSRTHPRKCFIRAGTTYYKTGGSRHLVISIKPHELYDYKTTRTFNNDVAVLLMAKSVDLAISVARVAIIPYQDAVVPDNSPVTAVGWGVTDEDDPAISTVLNEVTMRKINLNTCKARYKKKSYLVSSSMICAGNLDVGGKGTCQGDSGGPLLYKGIVVGITSWGARAGCAHRKYPKVYARVANYTNWINDTINDSQQKDTGNGIIKPCNTGSLSSKVGAITLLTSLLCL